MNEQSIVFDTEYSNYDDDKISTKTLTLETRKENNENSRLYRSELDNKIDITEQLSSLVEFNYLNKELMKISCNQAQLSGEKSLGTSNKICKENKNPLNASKLQIELYNDYIKKHKDQTSKFASNKNIDKGKISRIQSLFKYEAFSDIDFGYIVESWLEVLNVYELLLKDENPVGIINSILVNMQPITTKNFINSFTDYNQIRKKVYCFYCIKLWTFATFVYFNEQNMVDKQMLHWFKTIFMQLLQSAYYIALIISKAIRHGLIKTERRDLENFTKKLLKLNFPNNIPLIQTLKYNNDSILYAIKDTLYYEEKYLYDQIERINLKESDDFEWYLKSLLSVFYQLLGKSYKLLFANIYPEVASQPIDTPTIKNSPEKKLLLQKSNDKRYTIVFDLDETLIHFKSQNIRSKFLIRPHTYNILRNLGSVFEIIVFTAAQKEYADFILNLIDKNNVIAHRLYREHCKKEDKCYVKVN